jgi:hypothetical protein
MREAARDEPRAAGREREGAMDQFGRCTDSRNVSIIGLIVF